MNGRYAYIEDTTWPVDDTEVSVEWKLRYSPLESLTRTDLLFAASVMGAYRHIGAGMFPAAALRRVRRAHKRATS